MGQNHCKHQNGSIHLNFDKPYYYPGDIVTGTIYLNILSALETKGIELSVKIQETVQWKDKEFKTEIHKHINPTTGLEEQRHETRSVDVLRKDKKTLFKNSCLIGSMMNNIFSLGQYAYPFSFTLPNFLPGSFEYYSDEISANIRYLVKARALKWREGDHELESKNILVVRQSQQGFSYPSQISNESDLTTWCFFKNGSSRLTVSFPKSSFSMDEHLSVLCHLDNKNSKLPCKNFKFQLIQTMVLRSQKHGNHTKYLTRVIAESDNTAHYNAGEESMRTIDLVLNDPKNPVLRNMDKCKHINLFKSPELISKLQASTKSQLIDCEYHLHVKACYDGVFCCLNTANCRIPVLIYVPEIQADINMIRPVNWNPQVMPVYNFNVSVNDSYYQNNNFNQQGNNFNHPGNNNFNQQGNFNFNQQGNFNFNQQGNNNLNQQGYNNFNNPGYNNFNQQGPQGNLNFNVQQNGHQNNGYHNFQLENPMSEALLK